MNMTAGNANPRPDIAGIVRDRIDEIKAIRSLLADVYRDAGDGRTLFRELVQNADDAGAGRLTFAVLESGWRDAQNSLLRGPALLVANDGPFRTKDLKGLHKAIGGSKEGDVDKIGTFGIGLKSVFHICEAFLYIGAAQSEWRWGVLNPWYGTGEDGKADPLYPDWDVVGEEDRVRLRVAVKHLIGETDDSLLLWIPLRRNEHDRGTDGSRFWLSDHRPRYREICNWFNCSTPAALLLAQCGHLRAIDARRAATPETLGDSVRLMRVARRAGRWLGRYREESPWVLERPFGGEIESQEFKWSVVGIESLDGRSLHNLRSHTDWPQTPERWNGRSYVTEPRKALAHAAVTVLRPVERDANPLGVRMRWAVFLPLDNHPNPSPSTIVESCGSSPSWDILLHGYFWPSQDRRSIPGVTDEGGDTPIDGKMRARWNRRLCEELLLPLLPRTLAEAVEGVDEPTARELLKRVEGSEILRNRMPHVTRRHWLLPVVAQNRVHWTAIDAERVRVLSIPKWDQAPEGVRAHFLASCQEGIGDAVFIEESAPRFSGDLDEWTIDHLECLLNSIPADTFASTESLRWIAGAARHALGPEPSVENPLTAAFAQWLARRIGEGALVGTTRRSLSPETRKGLRKEWRSLRAAIPNAWWVETPVDTRQAVEELARLDGILGEGLLLLPVGGKSIDTERTSHPETERLDRALTALGERLRAGGESDQMRISRLLLTETLLSMRPECPMDAYLRGLPILRTTRMPEDKQEAWSITDLVRQAENHRVFARGTADRNAVADLAKALDEPCWLVKSDTVTYAAHVPAPESEALAEAVLHAREFAEPTSRKALLVRIVPHVSGNDRIRLAARTLLTRGAADDVGRDTELFQAYGEHESSLRILLDLLGQSWRAVDGRLVSALSHSTLKALAVSQADRRSVDRLVEDCLTSHVKWTGLADEEALHLLRHLYNAEPERQRRWRRVPLHRYDDGTRGELDERTYRSIEAVDASLPREFRAHVRVLDPDPEVSHLYNNTRVLNNDHILRWMLKSPQPWRFADRIMNQLLPDGQVSLPRDQELRNLLRESRWLRDRDGEGVAPTDVLIAPQPVLDAVRGLAEFGAFGSKRLPDAFDPPFWPKALPVVREVLGRMRWTRRVAEALDSDRVAQVDGGAWLVIPDPEVVDDSFVSDALETTLVGNHPGWKLLHTVDRIRRPRDSRTRDNPRQLRRLAISLCAPVPLERQLEMLTLLTASRPAKDSPGGRMFRRLLDCLAETSGFFEHVLPRLDLPTQDGNWHASREVARTEIGVARRHRLVSELRPALRLHDDNRRPQPTPGGYDSNDESAFDALRPYFEPWRNRIAHRAVGAFLSLLGSGSGGEIARLAEEWLGEDLSIEGMRSDRKLVGANGEDPCADVVVWVTPRVSRGDRVLAVNVIGEWVEMDAEPEANTLFAIDPERYPGSIWGIAPREPFWEISLRDVDPQHRTSSELLKLLGATVERWATKYLNLDRERVNDWWSRKTESSKADLIPVLASIKAHLPLTLRQLNVEGNEPLRDALREAERAQRKREQAPSEKTQAAIRIERESLDRLAKLIKTSGHQDFLWKRVNELMHRYGYRPDSVLLELAQNADDALAEAFEIKDGPLPPTSRQFLVRVWEDRGTPTVDVMHWGRTINDTGGAAFRGSRHRQWDQDIYFMMLMNLSGKPGEPPGEGSSSATTGRFGLGFKSVHLVSSSPSVVSGFIAFSIAGGLLPLERAVPEDADSWKRAGRRATLVRLPLRSDRDTDKLIESLFGRFAYARALLPVFARQVQEVVVEGGPYPGVHAFDGDQIEGASAWSIGAETELPNHGGGWRILRFRPSDSRHEDMGTAALAVGLRDDTPTAFELDVPFLWNVTPTSEEWACGYVVNGPFKLDPGRTHVSLDDDATLKAVDGLGNALGRGLIELHDVLADATAAAHRSIRLGGDSQNFLSSLWEVLASGVNRDDRLRREFVLRLHGNGRGISAWMAARSVVPTKLPAPFPPVLPPLPSGMSWEVATGGLDDPELCAALAGIDDEDFRSLVGSRPIVSAKTDRLLALLHEVPWKLNGSTKVAPWDLLGELAERWDYLLTPARLHALRPLANAVARDLVSNDPYGARWRRRFRACSATGSCRPLQRLLLQDAPALRDQADEDLDDELLRSAFAPDARILDPAYIECTQDWILLRWLRVQHRVDAAEVADWYTDIEEDLRPAALRYLLHGGLRDPVLSRLIPLDSRPSWLGFERVDRILESICDEPWRRRRLLVDLYPDRFCVPESPRVPVVDSGAFFNRLSEWWDDDAVRSEVTADYESRAWPEWLRRDGDISDGLQAGSKDHWLALLVLGACQSLGRTRDEQHRGFFERAYREGWWDVFKHPDDDGAWMRMLREWQDEASGTLPYARWMSLFPTIYQLSRYRDVYVRLLKSAGQRRDNMYEVRRLLAPKVDQALSGAGTHFGAPPAPLNMGLHWVLRELVRLRVVEGEHLYRDCWVPSRQVIDVLGELGFQVPADDTPNPEKARAICKFMVASLKTATPTLHQAFDIPLRYVASNQDLRRQFGLEQ